MRLVRIDRPNEVAEAFARSMPGNPHRDVTTIRFEVEIDSSQYKSLEDLLLGLISLFTEEYRKRYRPDLTGNEPALGGLHVKRQTQTDDR